PPLGLSRPSRSDTRYRLDVVQQPVRARCCGFGEKDRRLIDPPPILQLFAENGNGQPVPVTPADSMLFVVQCEIYCEKGHENRMTVLDHNNCPGVFFIFHDLSVRTEGRFRLKFTFIDLAAGEPLTMSTRIQTDVLSEPFTVYTAKKFPGMAESTALSKAFARQGIKINIRR
ncbi:velvet factor, partial [Syncephalastrum racemosum]